eukprot:scaffold120465_cov55-Attheya_sp.AAC.1
MLDNVDIVSPARSRVSLARRRHTGTIRPGTKIHSVCSSGLSTDVTAETLGRLLFRSCFAFQMSWRTSLVTRLNSSSVYQRVRSEISTPLESWAPLLGAPRPAGP